MRIEYHPAIEHEIREIKEYYDECSNGLGEEFLDEFEHHILEVASSPFQWMIATKDIRRSLMKRFPYVIYFRVKQDILRVIVVKHQRRHPKYGMNRS